MLMISASHLRKIWLRCGKDIIPEWLQELQDIRALTAGRLQKAPSHDRLRTPVKGSVTVTLLHDNSIRQTPSITLTSTPDSLLTMDINTWDVLGLRVWPAADVHITLFQKARKQHKRDDECSDCRKAARKNRKYMEEMTGERVSIFDLVDYWADREAWEQRMQEFEAEKKATEEHLGLEAKRHTIGMLEKHIVGKTERVAKRESDKGMDALVKKMGEMSLREAEVKQMVIAQDIRPESAILKSCGIDGRSWAAAGLPRRFSYHR
jgi:hypothetical protein